MHNSSTKVLMWFQIKAKTKYSMQHCAEETTSQQPLYVLNEDVCLIIYLHVAAPDIVVMRKCIGCY